MCFTAKHIVKPGRQSSKKHKKKRTMSKEAKEKRRKSVAKRRSVRRMNSAAATGLGGVGAAGRLHGLDDDAISDAVADHGHDLVAAELRLGGGGHTESSHDGQRAEG